MFNALRNRYKELNDLQSWREWLVDVLSLIFVVILPVSLLLFFPIYVLKENYSLIIIDTVLWLLLLIRSFFPIFGYRFRALFWMVILYTLTITYYAALGPGYARPVWMVVCVVMASVFFGSRAAILSIVLNVVLLMAMFFIFGGTNPAWSVHYRDGLMNWILYITSSTLLSLLAGLPVGFLILRLGLSQNKTRLGKEELQAAMEELEATNEELIRSSEDLMQKEFFIRRIMENAPAAMLRIITDTAKIEYANPRIAEFTGYALEEFKNAEDLFDKVIPQDWRKTIVDYWGGFLKGESNPLVRYPIIRKNGERRWIEQRSVLVRERTGNSVAVEGFCVDITRQVEVDDALRESEEKYRNLVENINEAVYSVDGRGILTYISPGIEIFGGFNTQELTGKSFFDFIHPDDRAMLLGRFRDLAEGVEMPTDYRIITPSGEPRWVRSSSRGIFRDGKFIGASGILTDIHDRRLAEDKLLQEMTLIDTMLETLPGIFFMLDGKGKFVRWKGLKKNEQVFGYSTEEMKEMTAETFLDEDERDQFSRILNSVLTEGAHSEEVTIRSKEGLRRKFFLSGSRMILSEEIFIIGIGIDITEQKRAEEERERARNQLVQAQKMEAVGTLAGGIAHDFNNMLGGIMGSVNMAEMLLKEKPVQIEAVLNYLETAIDSSLRAAEMTKGLLTLSRKSELKLVPVDINISVKHVMKLCKNSFPKSVELDFRTGDTPLIVNADPVQIEQVILNLCVNASQSMTIMRREGERRGGVLRVEISEFRCDKDFSSQHAEARPDEIYISVRVSDNGIGMNEETRRHIFDPFYTTKEAGEGTGLGLSMAYSIVQKHGGFIDVASDPGRGSVLTAYLPAIRSGDEKSERAAVRPAVIAGSGRILVIDDEKSLLGISRGMLEHCGYSVVTADNGEEGIECYRRDEAGIDGVLLDYSLPGSTGLDIFKQLKELNPDVKVLLTSGFMEDDVVKKSLALGIRVFIQKPYSIEELSAKMKEALTA